jgi:hypothetical protein
MRISQLSQRQMRIGGSVLIAVLMVAGAYIWPAVVLPHTKAVNAALTDDILASYVSKDSDSDGLPDWQEALYGTDPAKSDTDGDGITDGDAVRRGLLTPNALATQLPEDQPITDADIPGEAPASGSITEQFSRSFFQAYMQASGGQPLSQEAQAALIQRLLADFNARVAASLDSSYSAVSIHTDPTVSVSAYAESVEGALRANVVSEDANALILMGDLIQEDDASALPKLKKIASAYHGIASMLADTRVPPQLANHHLMLLQAFDSLGKSVDTVANYQKDPLAVLGALAVYTPAAAQMSNGFDGIATEILRSKEPATYEPGYVIVDIARTP